MKIALRLLGFPIASITVEGVGVAYAEDEAGFGGGSAHNFERDVNPLSPDDRYDWEYYDKGGFGFTPQ